MKSRQQSLARRDFLHAGIGAIATFGCFTAAELKAARAAAQVSRKAVLTRDSLMARIPPPSQIAERKALATALNKTIANYLEENFELTDTQRRNLRGLPASTLEELQQGLQKALENNMTIEIQELQGGSRGGAESRATQMGNFEGNACKVRTRSVRNTFLIEVGNAPLFK
jgi:hypothetical protein